MITQHELDQAYRKFLTLKTSMPRLRQLKVRFDDYVGFRYIREDEWVAPPNPNVMVLCPAKGEQRVQSLLSANGATLLLTWAIQQRMKKSPK